MPLPPLSLEIRELTRLTQDLYDLDRAGFDIESFDRCLQEDEWRPLQH